MFLLFRGANRTVNEAIGDEMTSDMMAGSMHFSQHHLGVQGTFPYSVLRAVLRT